MNRELGQIEFLKWADDEVGNAFFRYLRAIRDEADQQLLNYEEDNKVKIGKLIGRINLLDELIRVDQDDINTRL